MTMMSLLHWRKWSFLKKWKCNFVRNIITRIEYHEVSTVLVRFDCVGRQDAAEYEVRCCAVCKTRAFR